LKSTALIYLSLLSSNNASTLARTFFVYSSIVFPVASVWPEMSIVYNNPAHSWIVYSNALDGKYLPAGPHGHRFRSRLG
jgi:hypothetical protein